MNTRATPAFVGFRGKWVYLAANATTQVFSGSGHLKRVVVMTPGASSNVISVYNNTGSDTTNPILTLDGTVRATYECDIDLDVGLKVVIGTGTAAQVLLVYDN